jgi:hypothetical protein
MEVCSGSTAGLRAVDPANASMEHYQVASMEHYQVASMEHYQAPSFSWRQDSVSGTWLKV